MTIAPALRNVSFPAVCRRCGSTWGSLAHALRHTFLHDPPTNEAEQDVFSRLAAALTEAETIAYDAVFADEKASA